MANKIATFAAGCFWHIEEEFSKLSGVVATKAGYTGGKSEYKNPTYKQVCSGRTGHAEAVQVEFDDERISYKELLDLFWKLHDPTSLNRQGPDIGEQYRSAIFYHNAEQKKRAEESKKQLQEKLKKEVVTEIKRAAEFWPAEEHHQKYMEKNKGRVCGISD
ncbi:MAG: peptide-methionine (S)-S-oxide reductase MsrA [archaeon]